MMIYGRTALLVTTALAAFAAPTLAQAQDQAAAAVTTAAAAQDPAAANTAPDSEDAADNVIVVTATKRTQTLFDVPQSISVVSGSTLEEQNASSIADYLKLVPGLQLNQATPGQGRLILRGVNSGGVASTVGVYMDETPFGSSSGLVNGAVLAGDFDTFDLDRIEVLRGPQGTIYGALSLSGVLKFVTKQPSTKAFTARGRVGIETVDGGDLGYQGNLVVNVPLSDTIAFRATGSYRKYGGFIDSIGTSAPDLFGRVLTSDVDKNINDSKSYGGRASLLFEPTDKISIRLTALAQDIKADAPSVIATDPNTLKRLYGKLSQSQFVPQFSDVKYRVYNGTGTFDLGFADLTTSTSYATQKQDLRNDYTFPLSTLIDLGFGYPPNEFIQLQDTNSEKFTQEVRLSGESHLLDWVAGVYYTNEDGLIHQDFASVVPGTLDPVAGPLLGLAQVDSKYEEIAGFADVTVHVTDRFDLDLGGRYSHNNQSVEQVTDGLLVGGLTVFPKIKSDENVFTFSVAPRFELNDNVSLYARVAKGFRPGGPNVVPPGAPADVQTYDSDSLISYEAGIKAQTDDGRFSIDAAAFHIDWKDIQLIATIDGFNINTNGGGAKSDGFELTATARPLRGLDLSLNAAYTNARLADDLLPLGPPGTPSAALDGDQLPFTPKFSAGLNGDYSWPLTSTIGATVGGSLRHVSSQVAGYDAAFRLANGHQRKIDSYQVIDVRAGLDFGKFSVDAYVHNLNNSAGRTSVGGTTVFGPFPLNPDGAINAGVIRPRSIGISLTAGL